MIQSRRRPEVTYFPAFEIVRDLENDPWEPDRRHVRREVVARVMDRFMAAFGDPGGGRSVAVAQIGATLP